MGSYFGRDSENPGQQNQTKPDPPAENEKKTQNQKAPAKPPPNLDLTKNSYFSYK